MVANAVRAYARGLKTGLKIALCLNHVERNEQEPFDPTAKAWRLTASSIQEAIAVETDRLAREIGMQISVDPAPLPGHKLPNPQAMAELERLSPGAASRIMERAGRINTNRIKQNRHNAKAYSVGVMTTTVVVISVPYALFISYLFLR